jgi:hypothetical protein
METAAISKEKRKKKHLKKKNQKAKKTETMLAKIVVINRNGQDGPALPIRPDHRTMSDGVNFGR